MTFADATDCWITGHLAQGVDSMSYEQRVRARSRRSERRFSTSMTAADDDNVELSASICHWKSPDNLWAAEYTR